MHNDDLTAGVIAILHCDLKECQRLSGIPPPPVSELDCERLAVYFEHVLKSIKLKKMRKEIRDL